MIRLPLTVLLTMFGDSPKSKGENDGNRAEMAHGCHEVAGIKPVKRFRLAPGDYFYVIQMQNVAGVVARICPRPVDKD
jgi:hypothetical protein